MNTPQRRIGIGMQIDYPEELRRSIARMIAAQCGPAFDLEDVRATLGSDRDCIATATDAVAAPDIAAALSNAVSRLHPHVAQLSEVRGVVAMVSMRAGTARMHGVRQLAGMLRAALPAHASVICAGVPQDDLDSEIQVKLWARICWQEQRP
jgi:hypothetical protein